MSTKRKGKKTDLGTGPTWVNPETSSTDIEGSELESIDDSVDVSDLDDAHASDETSRTTDETFDSESASVSEAPIPEPEPMPEPLPEPEAPPPTLEEQIMTLTGERDALRDRVHHFETHHGELIEQSARYNDMISQLQADKSDLATANGELGIAHAEGTMSLDNLRGEHVALSLAHSNSQSDVTTLRARLEAIQSGKIYQFYPSQGGGGVRTYVLAESMPEAVKKFEDAGGNHDEIGHVSVVVDKLLI